MSDINTVLLGSLTVAVFILAIVEVRRLIRAIRTPVGINDQLPGEKFMNWLRKLLSIPSPSKELLSAWEKGKEKK